MATGVFRGEGAAMAEAERRRRAAARPTQGVVVQPGFIGPLTRGTTVAQGPRLGETMTQAQLARSIIERNRGAGLPGGGFWEGGDIAINPVTRAVSQTPAARQANAQADPWARVNWGGLGNMLREAGIPLQGETGGTGGGTGAGTGAGTSPGAGTGGTPGTIVPSQPVDPLQSLLAALTAATEAGRTQINTAGQALQTGLVGRDPMAAFEWSRPAASIPTATLANYVQAIGGSPAEVQATQQLNQELLNAALGDVGQFSSAVNAAQANWRGAQQDIGRQMTADALQRLALNEQAQRMAINMAERNRQQGLQDQALNILLNYATARPAAGGGALNVTTPNLPFNTVNIPGVGNVYVPSTLGGMA